MIERTHACLRRPHRPWPACGAQAGLLATCLALASPSIGRAQDIEPRAYSNVPVGVNFLIAGSTYAHGGYTFDPSVPIRNAKLRANTALFAYARGLDLWGASGKFDMVVPYSWLSGTADFIGQPVARDVDGFGDPAFRLSVNFHGAPALSLKEFRDYRQDLIVGASLRVTAPWGRYDDTRLLNIGTNRWSFKPEIGASKALGRWILETAASATFYTRNEDFYGGSTRSQEPVYAIRGHAIYSLPSGVWGSVDATFFGGGRTTVDGVLGNDLQQNWRVGATLVFPVDVHNSVKVYGSRGVAARTGNSFDLIGIAWQCRWGGGL